MKIVKLLWFFLNLIVISIVLAAYFEVGDLGVWDVLVWIMHIISFPLGSIFTFLLSNMNAVSLVDKSNAALCFILVWLGYWILGYVQWFKLLPTLLAYLRRIKININK